MRKIRPYGSILILVIILPSCSTNETSDDLRSYEIPGEFITEVEQLQLDDGLFDNPSQDVISEKTQGNPQLSASVSRLLQEDAELPENIELDAHDGNPDVLELHTYGVLDQSASYSGDFTADLLDVWAQDDVRDQSPGAKIAYYRTWAAAWGAQDGQPVPSEVLEELGEISPEELADYPYLLYALQETYRLLGEEVPEGLNDAVQDMAQESLAMPQSEEDIQDLYAIVVAQSERGHADGLPDDVEDNLAGIAANDNVDIQMRAYAAATLKEAGESTRYQEVLGLIHEDRSPVDGLYTGTMRSGVSSAAEATYFYSELLDDQFGDVAKEQTAETLFEVVGTADWGILTRLQAAVALDHLGHEPDEVSDLVQEVQQEFGATVTMEDLARYMELARTVRHLDPEAELAELEEFGVEDEHSERLAMNAIAYSYLFENQDDVRVMFDDLQRELGDIALDESTQYERRVFAAAALPAAGTLDGDHEVLDAVDEAVESGRGCSGSDYALARNGENDGICDLELTMRGLAVAPAN